MTEQERIDRETLLRRAAAVAGAAYAAPVLTSSVAAEPSACSLQRCTPGRRGDKKCRRVGGTGCRCIQRRCQTPPGCIQDERCPPSDGEPCRVLQPCGRDGRCACLLCIPNREANNCMTFRAHYCSDYVPCSKEDGSGCPPGDRCYDSCCPGGICDVDCATSATPRIARGLGSGPRLTL